MMSTDVSLFYLAALSTKHHPDKRCFVRDLAFLVKGDDNHEDARLVILVQLQKFDMLYTLYSVD